LNHVQINAEAVTSAGNGVTSKLVLQELLNRVQINAEVVRSEKIIIGLIQVSISRILVTNTQMDWNLELPIT
ncbi:MAG: hypothetical protein NTV34_20395, partial [Proteobacteria bacterium]|nr:hypothetical protein [Pseudomonadota bacterium]